MSNTVAIYPMSAYSFRVGKPGSFFLLPFEEGHSPRLNRFVPHRHDFFEIIWISAGHGRVCSDMRSYPFAPHHLFFAAPGQVHAWELDEETRGEIVSFTPEFFALSAENPGFLARIPFFFSADIEPLVALEGAQQAEVADLFRQLRAAAGVLLPGRDDIVRAFLTIILGKTRQYAALRGRPTAPEKSGQLASRFRLALEENFPRLLEVGQYASVLHVSRSHLNEALRRETGRSASEFIHERILLEAKRLIAHSTMTIAEIAYHLRFQDPSYFGRFFAKYTRQTPGMYRRNIQRELLAG